jgi:hypothetical protein
VPSKEKQSEKIGMVDPHEIYIDIRLREESED